jgi:type I restriction enzyme S subunit
LSTSILKLRELLHSDDSGEWGESPSGTNDLLILRAGNIADETWLDLSDVVHRTITEPKRTKLLLREGDILLERSGGTDTRPVGRVAFVDRDMEAGFSNFLHRLRVNRSVADPSYVRFVLAHWHRSGRAVALQTQTTGIRNLMFSRYLDEPIRLPSLINQRKFASILESATASLAHADALIAAKREQKRGLMQQLLAGKVRFPGFTEPWKTVRLGDIAARVTRRNNGASTRVLTASGQHGLIDQREFFSRRVASAKIDEYFLLKRGEFAYNRSAMQGYEFGAIKRLERYDEAAISTLYVCFGITSADVDSDFLAQLFDSRVLDSQLRTVVRIGIRDHGLLNLDLADFFEMSVRLPGQAEQQQIARVLTRIDNELRLLLESRAAFSSQRRGLMERLLSGEIDIPSSDTSAA